MRLATLASALLAALVLVACDNDRSAWEADDEALPTATVDSVSGALTRGETFSLGRFAVCGDGACSSTTEDCVTCPADCGACKTLDVTASASTWSIDGCVARWSAGCKGCACEADVCAELPSCCTKRWSKTCASLCRRLDECGPVTAPACGDGACDGTETCSTCASDCGACPPPPPACGDGACNGPETCSTCASDCGACDGLPAPWAQADVGSVGLPGGASAKGASLLVQGAGADIWGQADAFHFVYQPFLGDGQIVAQVTTLEPTDPWAKVGVMLRESVAAGSRHAMMLLTPGNGAGFQRRESTGGWSQLTSQAGTVAPRWVRLVRAGTTVTGYVSADGAAWTQVGNASFTLQADILIGLAVSAGTTATLCDVTFDGVTVSSGTPVTPPACGDGACNGTETCSTCASDCGACTPPPAACGDGACDGTETCSTCASDCGACTTSASLAVTAGSISSNGFSVSWAPVSGVLSYRVWLGPEPADPATGVMPLAVQEQTLGAPSTGATLSRLAAGTDAFVVIEAVRSGQPSVWGQAHARTLGGPGAALASALREVHASAPRVLELVLANPGTRYSNGSVTGNLGASFQAGQWQVSRSNGAAVTVTAVYRHSLPVGQPEYPVGYDKYGSDDVVDVDHRIFLVLAEPIGARELLWVRHTGDTGTALDVRVPFSDRYLETSVIQVNQVGYNARATKRWAYVSGWLGNGGALSLGDFPAKADVLAEPLSDVALRKIVVANLAVTPRAAACTWAGAEVREIDLASVPAVEGRRLRVRLPGVGVSFPTAVSREAAAKAFFVATRGLYLNRWCGDLDAAYTDWSRPADHCQAYFVQVGAKDPMQTFPSTTPMNAVDLRPLRGGHHDAGDFDIRPYHVLVAQYLLRAYEVAPEQFSDGQMYVPETGNGIPDLLDEALWSVAAWEALQNPDGSVRMGAESYRHPAGIYEADDDKLPYWTYDPVAWHTAYVAALFAQAAWLVEPFDVTRASGLRDRAAKAYAWAVSQAAPTAYLLYAASELYRATGQAAYRTAFEAYWSTLNKWGGGAFDSIQVAAKIYPGAFTGYAPAMADFVMGYVTAAGSNASIVSTALSKLTTEADKAAGAVLASPLAHRHARSGGTTPDWGVDVATGRDGDMIYQRLQLGGLTAQKRQEYLDALSVSADYQLGCNPAGVSFISGLGSRSPQQPLHNDSLAMQKARGLPPVPGLAVYGPVDGMPGSSWYLALGASFFPAFGTQPGGLRYLDSRTAVNMSEFTVWETLAPTAQLFSVLVGSDALPPDSWLPGAAEHRSPLAGRFAE